MSTRTLGLSGLDRDEETLFRNLFAAVREPGWELVDANAADVLLIDFDSMYGQMAWLRAQSGSQPIVALTAAKRADVSLVLHRPVSEKALRDMLRRLAEGAEAPAAPQPQAESPPDRVPVEPLVPPSPAEPEPAVESAPELEIPPARERTLIDFLRPGVLPGPARLRDSEPAVVVDVAGGHYLGGTTLKPLAAQSARAIEADEWELLSHAEFSRLASELGGTQPLNRLLWLAGLNGYDGHLCPDLADGVRFKLGRWPQSEREFPRQFRIATALLKQFGTLDEMAAASGASVGEVADFINACHALGMIEVERPAPPPPAPEAAPRGGLLGRLRRG